MVITPNRRQHRKLAFRAPEGDEQREIIKRVDAADDAIKAIDDKVTALGRLRDFTTRVQLPVFGSTLNDSRSRDSDLRFFHLGPTAQKETGR